MNKILATTVAAALAGVLASPGAFAQASDTQKRAVAEKWKQMTPEEQAEAKAKAKAKWESMSPEEQAAAKERFAKKHPKAAQQMQAKQGAQVQAPASAPAK